MNKEYKKASLYASHLTQWMCVYAERPRPSEGTAAECVRVGRHATEKTQMFKIAALAWTEAEVRIE